MRIQFFHPCNLLSGPSTSTQKLFLATVHQILSISAINVFIHIDTFKCLSILSYLKLCIRPQLIDFMSKDSLKLIKVCSSLSLSVVSRYPRKFFSKICATRIVCPRYITLSSSRTDFRVQWQTEPSSRKHPISISSSTCVRDAMRERFEGCLRLERGKRSRLRDTKTRL